MSDGNACVVLGVECYIWHTIQYSKKPKGLGINKKKKIHELNKVVTFVLIFHEISCSSSELQKRP